MAEKPRLYGSEKFMFFPEHVAALRAREIVAPVHIRIKPMNHCNHDCWYCAYRVSNLQLGQDIDYKDKIPEAKMFEIADDIVAMGVKAVTFSGGGEPLLYKPLPDVIDRLAAGGVRIAALTNGSNLKGRMADAFAEHGTWIRVSTDAWDDDSYVKLRGAKPGEFSRLLDNMRAFTARGTKCVLGVSFITDRSNCDRVFEICRLFRDVGVNHVKVSGVVVGNSGAENNAYHAPIRDTVARQVVQAKELENADFTVLNHYHDLDDRFEKHYTSCPYLSFLTIIGADCKVYTCQDKAYTEGGTLGSIKDRSFREFWFSEENRRAIQRLDPSQSCNHHCVTHSKNLALLGLLDLDAEHANFV